MPRWERLVKKVLTDWAAAAAAAAGAGGTERRNDPCEGLETLLLTAGWTLRWGAAQCASHIPHSWQGKTKMGKKATGALLQWLPSPTGGDRAALSVRLPVKISCSQNWTTDRFIHIKYLKILPHLSSNLLHLRTYPISVLKKKTV